MNALTRLGDTIARHAPGDGLFPTPFERLSLIRAARPTLPMPVVYEPLLCLVVQGRKQAVLGERIFEYRPKQYLIVGVEVPVVGHVTVASPAEPYLAFALALDRMVLGELVTQLPPAATPAAPLGPSLHEADPDLLDASARLLRLLDDPAAAPVLAPLAEREILFRLLAGPFGPTLRQMVAAGSRVAQVSRAIAWIKQRFAEPFSIAELTDAVAMSPSTLHDHFRAVTAMSPLQYQKQLRLQEARRLMLSAGLDAATAAFRVGYESPSQFSREYRRLFGEPPARNVQRLRTAPELTVAA